MRSRHVTDDNNDPIIGVLPGQGFVYASPLLGDDDTITEPVIGWVVRASGITQALILDSNGVALPIGPQDGGRVHHPAYPDS